MSNYRINLELVLNNFVIPKHVESHQLWTLDISKLIHLSKH